MFYSQFILAKKGPLGTIWIAAHLERKLRKNQVADTDIGVSVDSILFPEMPIALRLSSHLLLGVVRIYSRKVNYLFDDCSEALLKVKQAFRSTAVDLPPEESTAPYHSITLPETFDLDDFELPDSDIFHSNYVDHHISSREQITLQDTMEGVVYSTSKFGLDERFGDGDASGLDLDEELLVEKAETAGHAGDMLNLNVDPQASVQARAPLKHDENHDAAIASEAILANGGADQMEDFDGDNEPAEYAQAPCTPGLWEEPNLSKIQETSACDDHQEPEHHNVTESVVNEKLENAASKANEYIPHEQENNQFEPQEKSAPEHHNVTESVVNKKLENAAIKANEYIPHEQENNQFEPQEKSAPEHHNVTESVVNEKLENAASKANEYIPHEQENNQFEPQEKSAPAIAMEHMPMDDLDPSRFRDPLAADQAKPTSPKPEVVDTIITTANGPEGVEDLPSENVMQKEPGVQLVNGNHENWVELQGNLDNTFHLTTQMDSNAEAFDKDNLDNPEDQALREPEVSKISTLSGSMPPVLKPCAFNLNHSVTNDENHIDPAQLTDVTSLHHPETSVREEPRNSFGDSALAQGEGLHVTNAMESNLQEIHVTEPGPHGVAINLSNERTYNVIQGDTINSYTSDFPAAEKFLSIPERVSDVTNHLLLPETTPFQENIVTGDGGYSGSDMLMGKKRSITESSVTTQSFNLVESSGFFATKTTAASVPDDDDLLSSILVGRSSALKVKPTPPPEMPSKRRRQSAPRTGVSKRKVLMDYDMVLHGDVIRQQLTNTEDIRRLRKKAPCTRPEISVIQKQFWEDELFDEAVFTGLSIKLASLHHQSYDLSKIKVTQPEPCSEGATDPKLISQNEENGTHLDEGNEKLDASLEPIVLKENKGEANYFPPGKEDAREAEPFEMPYVPDNYENNVTTSYNYASQEQMHVTSEATEPIGSEHGLFRQETAMEIDGETFSATGIRNSVVPAEVESLTTDAIQRDPHDMTVEVHEVEKTSETVASLQMDAPVIDQLSVDMHSSMDISSSKYFENSEINVDVASAGVISETKHELVVLEAEDGTSIETSTGLTHYLESGQVINANTTYSMDTDGLRPPSVALDHDMEEIRKNEQEIVNEDKSLPPGVELNANNLVSNGVSCEEFAAYNLDANLGSKDVLLDDQIPGYQDTYPAETTNIDDAYANNRVDGDELEYSAVGNDTDFLNFDDDDDDNEYEAEAAGDHLPKTEGKRFIDNSGWSSRTKAVAKYLHIMFDKEGERGRMSLRVDNLLAGKTRKEASRMFFETLVLKTKDYIHVEQTDPFENIDILPRSKLLKSDF